MNSSPSDPLRSLLAAHLGGTLTPEICAAIEQAARPTPGRPIDLHQFEPASYEANGHRYVLAAERLADILADLHPLHEQHWLETEKHRHGLALNPDYQGMKDREQAGALMQFTARCDGELVAHVRMYLGRSLHTQTLFAEEDTLFVAPPHRGGFLVMALMRYGEGILHRLGVREIRADSKLLNRADVLMRRMGYTPVALKFHKFFED